MKTHILTFFSFAFLSAIGYGQITNLDPDAISLALQKSGNNLNKFYEKDKAVQDKTREIKTYINKINDFMVNNKSTDNYLISLRDYSIFMDSIYSTKNNLPDSVKKQMVNAIYEDIMLKVERPSNIMGVQTVIAYKVPVIVKTVKLENGKYVEKNGYRVKCNPWLLKDNINAKYNFNNPTNPISTYELPPGYYDIWVESDASDNRLPLKREKKTIPVTSSTPIEIIIEVN